MTRVTTAICDRCGQEHCAVDTWTVHDKHRIATCAECKLRAAKERRDEARRATWPPADRRVADRALARVIHDAAVAETLIRWVMRGRSELESIENETRFWDDVRKEIER